MSTATQPLSIAASRLAASPVKAVSPAFWGLPLAALGALVWGAGLALGFSVSLTLLTLLGFAAAIAGLRWPALGLLGISMLCTLDALSRNLLLMGGLLRYNTFNYWLLVVMLLGAPIVLHLKDLQTRILQTLLVVLGLGLFITPDLKLGVLHILNVMTMFGLMVYLLRALDEEGIWFWLGVVNGVVGAAGGLVFFLQQSSLPELNANAVSKFPLTALLCVSLAAHFVPKHTRPMAVLGLLAAVNLVWIFLTGSRGAMLIGLACGLFLLLEIPGFSRRAAVVAVAVGLGLAVLTQFDARQQRSLERITKLFDPDYSLAGRTSGRSDLALAGWYLFLEHPFGVGTGGFAETWERLGPRADLSGAFYHQEKQAHSAWIKTLTESGLPGILLLVGYVLSFAVSGWTRRRQGLLGLGLLATATLGVAFISTEFQGKGFWLMAAAATAALHHPRAAGKEAS